MKLRIRGFAFIFLCLSLCYCAPSRSIEVDVLVAGGSASGTVAGIQSSRMGARTLIVEESGWLGGMLTSAGVSAVDGNYELRGGLWGEFFDRLAAHYGSADSLRTGWVSNTLFEPHVGAEIWASMAAAQSSLEVRLNTQIDTVWNSGGKWHATLRSADGRVSTVSARVLIDASELGDFAAMAGVKYDIGMESRSTTGESIAPDHANGVIQDLTYVMILKAYNTPRVIARPQGYDSTRFLNTAQWSGNTPDVRPGQKLWPVASMLTYGRLPNGKYMINWPICGNDYYLNVIEMPRHEREKALRTAKAFSLQYLYFMQTSLGLGTLGLADDEFATPDSLPFIPYYRESRRIHGLVRFTVDDAARPYERRMPLYRTSVAVGDYPVDHHHARFPGADTLPELHFYPIPSYGLPMGVMLPEGVEGLVVAEKSVSVSNIVNGTTRLQPVVLGIGQAAGTVAALAVQKGVPPSQVPVREVQNALLESGAYLLPYLDIKPSDRRFKALQRIGATGILRGEGRNEGWKNQTWFRIDSLVDARELAAGIREYYGREVSFHGPHVTRGELQQLLADLGAGIRLPAAPDAAESNRPVTRGEFALIFDEALDPFSRPVDLFGRPAVSGVN